MATPHNADRPRDWYAVLGLTPQATAAEITAAIERMARQANALAMTAPDRARLLRDQIRVIKRDLLAGPGPAWGAQAAPQSPAPEGRPARPAPQAARPAGLMSRLTQFLQTGWACAECGYEALPTDKFCPKCGSKIQPAVTGPAAASGGGGAAASPAPNCRQCGRNLAPENAFCIWCGAQRT
jgi:Double zinc ribbon